MLRRHPWWSTLAVAIVVAVSYSPVASGALAWAIAIAVVAFIPASLILEFATGYRTARRDR